MGKPKVKKEKSGSRNDSTQVKRKKEHRKGDGGFISDRIRKIKEKTK